MAINHPTTNMDEPELFILEDAIETVYERPDTHGSPEDSFKTIANLWNEYVSASAKEGEPFVSPSDVSNMMILLKVARNAEGHYHEDNWTDIAGYAENGARIENE